MTAKKKTTLNWLAASETRYPKKPHGDILETFANTHTKRDYEITFDCPEYTSVCPITKQPDFAHIEIRYTPAKKCIESKSLKLYLYAYRHVGIFFEAAVNTILDDLVRACQPKSMTVVGHFSVRGGIGMTVEATFKNSGQG